MKKLLVAALFIGILGVYLSGCNKTRRYYSLADTTDLTEVLVNVPTNGSIDGSDTSDTFTVVLTKGKLYKIKLMNPLDD